MVGATIGFAGNAVAASQIDSDSIVCNSTPGDGTTGTRALTATAQDDWILLSASGLTPGTKISFMVGGSGGLTAKPTVTNENGGNAAGTFNVTTFNPAKDTSVFTVTSGTTGQFRITRVSSGEDNNLWNSWSATCIDGPPPPDNPAILTTKSETSTGPYVVDQDITFDVTVTNIGIGGDLTNVQISDPSATFHPVNDCDPDLGSSLAPGASLTCEVTHTVTQGDIDAGSYENCATGSSSTDNLSDQACVTINFVKNAQIETTKELTNPKTFDLGDDIIFTVAVKNTGNVTLTEVDIEDPSAVLSVCSGALGGATLAPGLSLTCTATHKVTAQDLANGEYTNIATGSSKESPSDEGSATVTDFAGPALTAVKSANPTKYFSAGETIVYTIMVTNTGNVTLTNLTVDDPLTGPPSCDATTLAPTEFATCTVNYTTTPEDVDRKFIENTATATTTETGPVSSNTVRVDDPPLGLELTKSANQSQFTEDDTAIDYTYTVRNAGSNTVTGLQVDDDKIANVSCDLTTLAPGQQTQCVGNYQIMPVDILIGQITNTATASATDQVTQGVVPSNTETVTVTYVGTTVEDKVDEVTRSFLFRRMDRLIADGPDRARLLRKQADRAFCGNGGSGADLGEIYAEADDEGMTAFGEVGCSLMSGDRFDLWLEGNFTTYDSDYGDGSFAVGYIGADWMVNDRLLVGLLGQFDWMSQDEDSDNVEGWGWMVGPYVSAELVDNLFFDARFAWGQSYNDVTVDNSGTPFGGDFDTERWLASARLSGNLTNGNWRVTPEVEVAYMEEKRKTFDVSDGGGTMTTTIDSETLALGRLTAGPEIAYRFVHGDITIEPQFAMRLIWDFLAQGDEISGTPIYDDSPRGAVELGVAFRNANGVAARISGKYDGIGTTGGLDAFSVSGWLNFPFR